MIQLFIKSKGY